MKTLCILIALIFNIFIPSTVIMTENKPALRSMESLSSPQTISQSDEVMNSNKKSMQESYSPNEIAHFFTHCLIAYPEIAFKDNNFMRSSYSADCVTTDEFKMFLENMYRNNYVLVDIRDTYTARGTPQPVNVSLPLGKKPLILSFDDVNYYKKKMHLGMNDKLVVLNGKIATYTQKARAPYNYDNEHITILENFIEKHPDFSHNNARGIICLTGFDGVLGYRTENGFPGKASEIVKAKSVIATLKSKGWVFACHSYAHYHTKLVSEADMAKDAIKWLNEVGSLIGKTDIYCYPYGEWDIGDGKEISAKQKILNDNGFRLFLGVGVKNFYGFAPWKDDKIATVLLMDRKPFDGIAMRSLQKEYSQYFDCAKIYKARLAKYPTLVAEDNYIRR